MGGQLAASSQEGREKDVEKRVKNGRQSKTLQIYKRWILGEQDGKLTLSHEVTRQAFLLTLLFFFNSHNSGSQILGSLGSFTLLKIIEDPTELFTWVISIGIYCIRN